jgi:hypothetical protein
MAPLSRPAAALGTVVLLLGFLPPVGASPSHAQWRYCLAVSPDRKEVVVTEPLLTETALANLEHGFDEWLNGQGIEHEAAACPMGTSPKGVEDLRDYAIRYNSKLGLSPRVVKWSE